MKIGVLQTGRSPESLRGEHGDYDEMCGNFLAGDGDEVSMFAALDGEMPESVDICDVWLITGSRHGVYEDHDWIAPLETFIRDAHAAGKKLVGICFGHQVIAQAMGGKVAKSDKGLGAGVMPYTLKHADGNEEDIALCAWHQDQVLEKPTGTEVIASSDFCPIAALTYGDQIISFQAHPEFSREYVTDLIEARRGSTLTDSAADHAQTSMKQDIDADIVLQRIRNFIDL